MHSSKFFKLFPPPKFLLMKHAGLDISDDSIRCIEFSSGPKGVHIKKYASVDIPADLIEGGEFKDPEGFRAKLAEFDKQHDLSYVRVSLPEEKVYLFHTEVPSTDPITVEHNIEFKLEENVPIPARDAVFYYDLLPLSVTGGVLRASVSVASRAYIERYSQILSSAGIIPVAYELIPKAIARAIIPEGTSETYMIVHIMKRKVGLYIAAGGVICFTSTIAISPDQGASYEQTLSREVNRAYSYWMSHAVFHSTISKIVLVGRTASQYEAPLRGAIVDRPVPVEVANVWQTTLDGTGHIPPLSAVDAHDYAVAAGLAIEM